MSRRDTTEDVAKIRVLAAQGKSRAEISKITKIGYQSVSYLVRKNRIRVSDARTSRSLTGDSIEEISYKTRLSSGTIREAAIKKGICLESRHSCISNVEHIKRQHQGSG